MGFYDAPELSSSGALLGVTHPPGHPLFVALASVAALLPVGTLAMRVSLLGGALVAVAGRAVFEVALSLANAALRPEDPDDHDPRAVWLAPALALSASLTGVLGPAVFRQATRGEVYALAGALACMLLAAVSAPGRPAPRARLAVLLLGLAGTNHTFIAVTTVPLALLALIPRMREGEGRGRSLLVWGGLGALSMLPYALLPLRDRAAASMIRVRTAGDMVWTVTAKAFQGNVGSFAPEPWSVRASGSWPCSSRCPRSRPCGSCRRASPPPARTVGTCPSSRSTRSSRRCRPGRCWCCTRPTWSFARATRCSWRASALT
jgi:hypothetical protein